MRLALLLALLACLLRADEPPPEISEAAKAAYWRARALASEARAVAEKAAAEQSKAELALKAVCGPDLDPQIDPAGDLKCASKLPVKP